MMMQDEAVHETDSGRRATMGWNVLATAKDHEQRHLARRLKRLGVFRWSPYLGVLIGQVEDHQAFFDQLRRNEEIEPGFLLPLARVVPLDKTLTIEYMGGGQNPTPQKLVFNLDGSPSTNKVMGRGGEAMDQVSKATWDGAKISITSPAPGGTGEVKRVISMEGANMVIETTAPGRE